MNETPQNQESKESGAASGGLYKNVKVSAKTVERVILVMFALLLVLLIVGISSGGYTVSFDARGGTDVPSQELEYGDLVSEPAPPSREGYVFAGWYVDEGGAQRWDFSADTVSDHMTLYARWTSSG